MLIKPFLVYKIQNNIAKLTVQMKKQQMKSLERKCQIALKVQTL